MCPTPSFVVRNTQNVAKWFQGHFAPFELVQRHVEPDPALSLKTCIYPPMRQHPKLQKNCRTGKDPWTDKRRPSNPGNSLSLANVTIQSEVPLSAGRFCDIYTGEWKGYPVCLKVIRTSSGEVDRWQHWRKLDHPNVLPFHGIYTIIDQISLVSPWMKNGNINEYLKDCESSDRSHLVVDVAQGLTYLHENGIVHGDLKGTNVLVSEDERAVLADFESTLLLSSDVDAMVETPSLVSQEGTARWRAPETFNFEGDEELPDTMASDVYAFAMVAYEIFANELPFSRLENDISIMSAIVYGERPQPPPPDSPSWSVWGLTNDTWSLMKACWLTRTEDRPSMEYIVTCLPRSK